MTSKDNIAVSSFSAEHLLPGIPALLTAMVMALLVCVSPVMADNAPTTNAALMVGTSSMDITPTVPVALAGHFRLRITDKIGTPLTTNVLALESRDGDKSIDMAILVSCDIINIPDETLSMLREELHKRLPALDVTKVVVNGTHTHTAPLLISGKYVLPDEGVTSVESYRAFFIERVADAIEKAWNNRKPGAVTWGLGHAVVAYNRRAVYADGSAVMYGKTHLPTFRGLEGYEDHDINSMFFWNADGELIAIGVNVSCPSQVVESHMEVDADFWHPVRENLRKRYGQQVCILGWTGAAGDQSPRPIHRKAAETRMNKRRGLDEVGELGRRITRAVEDTYEVVKDDRHANARLVHRVEKVTLPMRLVTEAEYDEAKAACKKANDEIAKDPKAADTSFRRMKWYQETVERFENQKTNPKPTYEVELHALRIGDAAICTNPFELFTDYGIQMKARSKAIQTFVIQLVGVGTYLPTERAVRGGGYSGVVHSGRVGPEGGQMLVDWTVQTINSTFGQGKSK